MSFASHTLPGMCDYTSAVVSRLSGSSIGTEVAGEVSQGKIKGCSMCHWHLQNNSQARKTKWMELHQASWGTGRKQINVVRNNNIPKQIKCVRIKGAGKLKPFHSSDIYEFLLCQESSLQLSKH